MLQVSQAFHIDIHITLQNRLIKGLFRRLDVGRLHTHLRRSIPDSHGIVQGLFVRVSVRNLRKWEKKTKKRGLKSAFFFSSTQTGLLADLGIDYT